MSSTVQGHFLVLVSKQVKLDFVVGEAMHQYIVEDILSQLGQAGGCQNCVLACLGLDASG